MDNRPLFDWRTISALNAVSAMAQVGQFGIAFVMLPVWLAEQGLDATQLGLFAASLWMGQIPGLALAPKLCRALGERRVIALGLLCTVGAFLWCATVGWPYWLAGGLLAGLGMGLRWIGVEPWLYGIAPAGARGRLVGFHETLIAFAPIVAPLLVKHVGIDGHAIFGLGALFTLGALLPLALTRKPIAPAGPVPVQGNWLPALRWRGDRIFRQGLVIAAMGGMMEAAVSGLFTLYTQAHGMSVYQTAELLAVFGLGGLLMQYGVGWVSDHRGVGRTALYCALGTIVVCVALARPLPYSLVAAAMFLLGGFITAFLTLALVASATTGSGTMAANMSAISMVYTASAVAGPVLAGAVIQTSNGDALMWLTAAAALLMVLLLVRLIPSATG